MMQPKNDFDNKSNDNADINIKEFTTPPPTTHHPPETFSWLLRVLDKSDGPRMGLYDLSMVREG